MFSAFANAVVPETAFSVLARAQDLERAGKDIIRLEIGDSPFKSSAPALAAGSRAILDDHCHYVSSKGIPELRLAAANYINKEYGTAINEVNVLVGNGAKIFQQLFCELFLNPNDGVLVFSPFFPTYEANIRRRGARMVTSSLRQDQGFRPNLSDVEEFIDTDLSPKAVFLNSPHNPTGGVATKKDIEDLCSLLRERSDIYLFSDEPYDQMAWRYPHTSPIMYHDMLERCVSVYTMSKSYSMSGWRVGFCISAPQIIEKLSLLSNTSFSCVSPFSQMGSVAALNEGSKERDERMQIFKDRVFTFAKLLDLIDGVECQAPDGAFYVFPNVKSICQRHSITSHGLATFVLEDADSDLGVACLGGESFGSDGFGFLRMSCAESAERLSVAAAFLEEAFYSTAKLKRFLLRHPQFSLGGPDSPIGAR